MGERQLLATPARVTDGRLVIADRAAFSRWLGTWSNCDAVLRLEEHRDARRAGLNAYYWGVVVDAVSEHTGYTPAEAHAVLKALHLSQRLHAMRGGSVCWHCARVINGTTRALSGAEEWRYVERCHIWAAEDGLHIPDPVGVQ